MYQASAWKWMEYMPNFENKLVEVCSECHMASCYHGEFMCENSRYSGTVIKSVSELRMMGLEHESHWRDDNLEEIYGDPAPNGYIGDGKAPVKPKAKTNGWHVHTHGPDDITGPYTEIDALKKANEINTVYIKECLNHGCESTPMRIATVEYTKELPNGE